MKSFRTRRHVSHSAADMFALVCDVESYPKFVPLCEGMKVRRRSETAPGVVELVADMQVGSIDSVKAKYKLIESPMESADALYHLPLGKGETSFFYTDGKNKGLVKGAYKEPATVAYQDKADVDAAFLRLMARLLESGTRPAIATHDPAMIEATRARAVALGLTADRFEFQMLYGIRRDLQTALTDAGLAVRIYLPFGTEWFPYFMRRLGERPANVGFVVRSLLHDR